MVLCLSQVGGRGLQSSTLKAAVGGHEALLDSKAFNLPGSIFAGHSPFIGLRWPSASEYAMWYLPQETARRGQLFINELVTNAVGHGVGGEQL